MIETGALEIGCEGNYLFRLFKISRGSFSLRVVEIKTVFAVEIALERQFIKIKLQIVCNALIYPVLFILSFHVTYL